MSPAVSVVVPSYNHATFVGATIESILDQSWQDFEIVVTDDASSDGTPDVIRKFTDPRILLDVFPANRGGVIAGNSAIRRASGTFIARVNSDDFFLPGKLEKQVEFLNANPHVAAVFSMPRLVDESASPLPGGYREFTFPFRHPVPTRAEWLRHFFFNGNCLCFPTMMIRRSVLDEIGLLDPRLTNLPDFDMWVRLLARHEIHVMPDELTAFRVLAGERNLGAPRPETLLRGMFEFSRILRHYLTMSSDLLREAFADDLATHDLDSSRPVGMWLAELALRGPFDPHKLFALECMFEAAAEDADLRRLRQLGGQLNIFRREFPGFVPNPDVSHPHQPPIASDLQVQFDTPSSRNALCHCGSGKRYKHCHGRLD